MLDDNVKGGSSSPWSRLKDPLRVLATPPARPPAAAPEGTPDTGSVSLPEPGSVPVPGRAPSARAAKVQALFALLGIVAAIAGAVWAWLAEHSLWLSLFAFLMGFIYVGIGLGDAVTGRRKARAFLMYTFLPVLSVGILLGTYRLWEMWWLSATLGFVGGLAVWAVVAAVVFPDVMAEASTT